VRDEELIPSIRIVGPDLKAKALTGSAINKNTMRAFFKRHLEPRTVV